MKNVVFKTKLERSLREIAKMPSGTTFTVKDTFPGVEWNAIPKGDRSQYGKYFKNKVLAGAVKGVVLVENEKSGTARYRKE